MRNDTQKIRYTRDELELMKRLFRGDVEKLYIIRKVMFQFELTKDEREALDKFLTEPVYALLTKTFLPYLDPEAPLFQMASVVLSLGADIKSLSPEGAAPYIKAKSLELRYLKQRLSELRGDKPQGELVVLNDLTDLDVVEQDAEQAWINVNAWNWLLSYIDTNIQQLRLLAGVKNESVEETLVRLHQNSSK